MSSAQELVPEIEQIPSVANTMLSLVKKINGFGHLENGWHFGSGSAVSDRVVFDAVSYAKFMLHFFDAMDAFPGVGGEILLKGYAGREERVELTFEPDQTYTLAYEVNGDDLLFKDGLSRSAMIVYLSAILKKVQAGKWRNTSESFTQFTTTTPRTALSPTWPLNQDPMNGGFLQSPVFVPSAPRELAEVFANTLIKSMQTSRPRLEFFGPLTNQMLMEVA